MNTNFREMLNMTTLRETLGVAKLADLNLKQKKAYKNIKFCANDQWQWVNSWSDHKDEDARSYMMDAEKLFRNVYEDSLTNVYDEGAVFTGKGAESYLKDIKFCGKEFLEKVTLYFVAKLMEESVVEVAGTEEDVQKVIADLTRIKNRIFCTDGELENPADKKESLVREYANKGYEIKKTRKGEEWISISLETAAKIREKFNTEPNAVVMTDGNKITAEYPDGHKYELCIKKNSYLWDLTQY